MTRITPRTCLWPLAGSLSLTFALSIGLTFRSNHHCFAGTCGEWLFPLQARLHVVIWYCWLGISITILAIRAFQRKMQKVLGRLLFDRRIPFIQKHMSTSGLIIMLWIVSLYAIIIGIWWIRLNDYFTQRGIKEGVRSGNKRLAAIALTGHMCDVTMGMAILPISRHSALSSFFKISVATTLTFHMLTAYTLFALVLTHGLLYISWVPVFEALSAPLRMVYPVLNPTYLYREAWPGNPSSLGIWRASLIFTGIAASSIMLLIFITTLPAIRNRHFNIFYFTHLLGIVAVVIICLHASTMFYCTAPGLSMWLLDWAMRLYELWAPLDGKIQALGKGWYYLTVPLPRRRLDGCACTSPLAHFYIHHSDSSIRELHPFTTTTHLASQNAITSLVEDDIDIKFLFRKRGVTKPMAAPEAKCGLAIAVLSVMRRMRRRKTTIQWTDRLAGLAAEDDTDDENPSSGTTTKGRNIPKIHIEAVAVSLRLEGPYFTPADPAQYNTVVCLVAGTGISGALAIAGAFKEMERQFSLSVSTGDNILASKCLTGRGQQDISVEEKEKLSISSVKRENICTRCIVVWSVREENFIELPDLKSTPTSDLEVRVHLTGNGRPRVSAEETLDQILNEERRDSLDRSATSMWVYISGPNAFIAAGEAACKKRRGRGVECYGAKWDI